MEALIEDENAMDKGVIDTVLDHKRKHDDDDEYPPAGPNQGKKTKRRRTKEYESSKKPSSTKVTQKGKAPSKGSKTGKSASAKEPVEEPIAEVIMDYASDNVVHDDDQPQDTLEPKTDKTPNLKWFTQPPRPPTPDLEWNKQYLKSSDPERTYTMSIMKTKAARYEIEGIEDMVPMLWSPTKVGYSTKKILGVKNVSVKKLHGYGHLEEIVVKRADRHLYKFKECDFVDLHMNNIKDMLLLAVQHKLFHLAGSDIVNFIMALCMFISSLAIKKRVEDL
ncbi:hypothetical protein Tco_0551869 [Tanacetum coccineum]